MDYAINSNILCLGLKFKDFMPIEIRIIIV